LLILSLPESPAAARKSSISAFVTDWLQNKFVPDEVLGHNIKPVSADASDLH